MYRAPYVKGNSNILTPYYAEIEPIPLEDVMGPYRTCMTNLGLQVYATLKHGLFGNCVYVLTNPEVAAALNDSKQFPISITVRETEIAIF